MDIFKDQIIVHLGPVVLGVALNTWLFGLVSFQYASYFFTDFRDPLWIKLVVCGLAIIDTTHSLSLVYLLWFYCVENYLNPAALLVPLWPYRITMFVTVATSLIMHMFLSYRIMRLTNRLLSILMIGLTALTFALGFACGTVTWIWVRTAFDMPRVNVILSVWFGFQMITDTVLSGTLIYILLKSRSGLPKSATIVNTLVRTAIQTGLAGSVFSILTLSFYIIRIDTQIFAIFGIPIARVYTNTLMDSLLCRENLRGILLQMNEVESISVDGRRISMRTAQPRFRPHDQLSLASVGDEPPSPLSNNPNSDNDDNTHVPLAIHQLA
ncbi:hypothetical protein BJ165DRAFT_1167126 [Panaeolus papilionaceus]|nr:hypothetical protein BJ165DRAFT_1167126 [Panaeolus papilionaceus]